MMEILKCPEVPFCLNPGLPPGQTTAPLTKSKSYSTNTVTMEHQWHITTYCFHGLENATLVLETEFISRKIRKASFYIL